MKSLVMLLEVTKVAVYIVVSIVPVLGEVDVVSSGLVDSVVVLVEVVKTTVVAVPLVVALLNEI